MNASTRLGVALCAIGSLTAALALPARADEIRLKDGKKLHGVIVAYEDNMFKVKTDFGYVLVEKDKIAQIIPDTPANSESAKAAVAPKEKIVPEKATVDPNAAPPLTNTSAKTSTPPAPTKREKAAAIAGNANARPEIPIASNTSSDATPPAIKSSTAAPKTNLAIAATPPPPAEEIPENKEEIQGNLYINHTHGFRMYKAPSWQMIAGAGQTLPNAIVAMGTSSESTLLVVAEENTKAPLESAAQTVEKRLHDVYDNYRLISQRKTMVGGLPAMEYHYRGMADNHDWSGTLVVVSRGGDALTILGMTYADNDLIQIQENVIARTVASVDFSPR